MGARKGCSRSRPDKGSGNKPPPDGKGARRGKGVRGRGGLWFSYFSLPINGFGFMYQKYLIY